MLTNKQIDVLLESIELRGVKVHEDYLTEEIGELLQAISKRNRGKDGATDNLKEELADVFLLVTALAWWYGAGHYVREKFERIDKILDRDWRGEGDGI